jgi:hypothetical protein
MAEFPYTHPKATLDGKKDVAAAAAAKARHDRKVCSEIRATP